VLDLKNKKVLVTGAANGLGLKIAKKFADAGSVGFGFDLKKNNFEIKKWEFYKVDVSDENEVSIGFKKIKNVLGSIDIVVANAGVVPKWRTIDSIDNEEWENVFNVNVKGVALTIKYATDLMKSSGGSIIIMGSINSLFGHSGQSLYTATKHALLGIVKCASVDLGKYNIRVNAIGPGPIATSALIERVKTREKKGGESFEKALENFASNTALGKMATEEDVANTAIYLGSNLSESITGHLIPVTNGLIRLE
tara:strand:- start:328 stop:1083 length:756 start_codon:yes stop_codon:yes gene_type:complete